ncbi:hypothetical protein FQA47_010302 [Oryzias melastigma]|uniref:Uncharacterized protein n=1 Tax=Oryzias melastigma TaxID=30732 RepID=A0A834F5W4_ORYME|nr:hypothetical protein FQA47_010302 [Oryzias melastigma]
MAMWRELCDQRSNKPVGGSCASLELLPLLFWRPASARTQRRTGLLFISSIDPPLNKADHLDFGAETASELRMLTDPSCSRLASKIQRTTALLLPGCTSAISSCTKADCDLE